MILGTQHEGSHIPDTREAASRDEPCGNSPEDLALCLQAYAETDALPDASTGLEGNQKKVGANTGPAGGTRDPCDITKVRLSKMKFFLA